MLTPKRGYTRIRKKTGCLDCELSRDLPVSCLLTHSVLQQLGLHDLRRKSYFEFKKNLSPELDNILQSEYDQLRGLQEIRWRAAYRSRAECFRPQFARCLYWL
jgi:hypothetical protein